jgi:hypothetical protein
MIRKLNRPDGFDHVEAWVFDLDNTLYPADCNLFAEIDQRMGAFISERFNMSIEAAQRLRKTYYYQYGTTLAGLMRLHDVCPHSFLDYVHDIDLSVVAPSPELREALTSLPTEIHFHQWLAQTEAITGRPGRRLLREISTFTRRTYPQPTVTMRASSGRTA